MNDVLGGGADFIVTGSNTDIVIEVGAGQKGYRQIISMVRKVNPKYSIIISKDDLDYSKDFNAIKTLLKYFLLI